MVFMADSMAYEPTVHCVFVMVESQLVLLTIVESMTLLFTIVELRTLLLNILVLVMMDSVVAKSWTWDFEKFSASKIIICILTARVAG